MMDPILAEFESEVRKVVRNKPQIPIVSSLYGRLATDEEWTDPAYWAAQLRHTVRFADAVGTLLNQPGLALLEVGPGQTLTTLARQNPAKQPGQPTIYSSPRTCKELEMNEFLSATGQLWLAGVDINWKALHGGAPRQRVPLPTYPFERQRYWIEPHRATALDTVDEVSSDELAQALNVTQHISGPSFDLEALIEEQLRIMGKQIETLRHASAANREGSHRS